MYTFSEKHHVYNMHARGTGVQVSPGHAGIDYFGSCRIWDPNRMLNALWWTQGTGLITWRKSSCKTTKGLD